MEIDVEIINRIKKGNKEAYGIIVKKYMKKAYFLALGFVGDTNDALDLSQMAFIKAYRSLSSFDQKRPFLPWFYVILRNLCLNFVKRKKAIPMVPLEEAKTRLGEAVDTTRKCGNHLMYLPGQKEQETRKNILLLGFP